MNILTINAGSSSIKFKIFRYHNKNKTTLLLSGQISQIKSVAAVLTLKGISGESIQELTLIPNNMYVSAIEQLYQNSKFSQINIDCIINKVAFGGEDYKDIVLLHSKTITALSQHNSEAPLHQPYNLIIAGYLMEMYPKIKHYACFDTGFHKTISQLNQMCTNTGKYTATNIQHYPYYGLSYSYIADRLSSLIDNKLAKGHFIIAHLGGGSSICGIKNGKSVVSTTGFSIVQGLPLLDDYNDMQDLISSKNDSSKLALKFYVASIASHMSSLITLLGGLNGIIFTGGVGMNSPEIRMLILERLEWLGISVNKKANNSNKLKISKKECHIKILVVPTDEEFAMVNQLIEHKL